MSYIDIYNLMSYNDITKKMKEEDIRWTKFVLVDVVGQ